MVKSMASTLGGSLNENPILFFDGVCGLCDRFVKFMMKKDKGRLFRFATLQGQTAQRILGDRPKEIKTIILFQDQKVYEQSEAILLAVSRLGGIWSLAKILFIFPAFIRDFVYQRVANNRYKIFGHLDSCRIPTEEEKPYFLD